MIMLQLTPPIPMDWQGRHAMALLVLDYGVDFESYFLLAMQDTAELWWRKQSECRAVVNETLERVPAQPWMCTECGKTFTETGTSWTDKLNQSYPVCIKCYHRLSKAKADGKTIS